MKLNKRIDILFLIIGLLAIIFLKSFVVDKKCVSGNSMYNTFSNGDVLLIKKIDKSIQRFDIVIINTREQGLKGSVIKRVIGMPNETFQIIDGYVYINNKKLKTDVVSTKIENAGMAEEKIILKDNEYFVLGDNRNASEDSRNEWLGVIDKSQIEGKPYARIYPFNKIDFSINLN